MPTLLPMDRRDLLVVRDCTTTPPDPVHPVVDMVAEMALLFEARRACTRRSAAPPTIFPPDAADVEDVAHAADTELEMVGRIDAIAAQVFGSLCVCRPGYMLARVVYSQVHSAPDSGVRFATAIRAYEQCRARLLQDCADRTSEAACA